MLVIDKTDLTNYMFLNKSDKIIKYIEQNFMSYAHEDIFKFITDLAVEVVTENIEECVDTTWSNEAKDCYFKLMSYYKAEKEKHDRIKFEKRQNTKGSLIRMDR